MTPPKNEPQTPRQLAPPLSLWSVQEIRRIAIRLAQRQFKPAHIIAWLIWRRVHQASARRAHLNAAAQL